MSNTPEQHEQESNILLAMPLLADDKIDLDRVINRLRTHWGLAVDGTQNDDTQNDAATSETIRVVDVDGHMTALGLMPGQVPAGDLESLYPVAFLWPGAAEEVPRHATHVIVSLMSDDAPARERYAVFTKVVESVLAETNSLGLYQGHQMLLVKKEIYIDMAEALLEDETPFLLWVFVGLSGSDEGNSLYTYGMKGFGKMEMEIINSQQDMDDLFDFLINVGCYVINSDVTFKADETLGYTESKDAAIEISPGRIHEDETIKLVM